VKQGRRRFFLLLPKKSQEQTDLDRLESIPRPTPSRRQAPGFVTSRVALPRPVARPRGPTCYLHRLPPPDCETRLNRRRRILSATPAVHLQATSGQAGSLAPPPASSLWQNASAAPPDAPCLKLHRLHSKGTI
jgi:hypothetical protein